MQFNHDRRTEKVSIMQIQKPIFILGPHKSGTSLLRSLLDSHPALFVLPYETHIFDLAGYWVDYRFRRSIPQHKTPGEIKQACIELAMKYNTTMNSMADAQLKGQLDLEMFIEKMDCYAGNLDELIATYFNAVYASLFGNDLPSDLRVVEKSVEHTEFAMDLASLFADAKFLHILRNPYSNVVALRRLLQTETRTYPFLRRIICSLNTSYYHLYRNARLLRNYKIVRYEDLLREPQAVMRSVADFLEIEFTPSLLEPSSVGRVWTGNSSRGIPYRGISDANLELWRDEITHLEIHYVNRFFGFLLEDYGYPRLEPSRNLICPLASELPHIYVLNRCLPILI